MADQLPEQILMDILLRVPAKTVGRCRCVSKPWRTILSTPYFIRSYLLSENINLLLLTCNSNSNTTPLSHTINKNDDAVSANTLRLPAGDNWRTRIFGSCAGLVLLLNEKGDEFLLVNPITLHHTEVPDSPLLRFPSMSRMHGFGYDTSVDDHKIVSVSTWLPDVDSELGRRQQIAMSVGVYYVKRGVWKILENSRYDTSIISFEHDPGACANGAIHWLTYRESFDPPPVITAFGLVDEAFTDIPLPAKLNRLLDNQVVILGGCLCVLDVDPGYVGADVWIMKEYGFVESWTKLCAIDIRVGMMKLRF